MISAYLLYTLPACGRYICFFEDNVCVIQFLKDGKPHRITAALKFWVAAMTAASVGLSAVKRVLRCDEETRGCPFSSATPNNFNAAATDPPSGIIVLMKLNMNDMDYLKQQARKNSSITNRLTLTNSFTLTLTNSFTYHETTQITMPL